MLSRHICVSRLVNHSLRGVCRRIAALGATAVLVGLGACPLTAEAQPYPCTPYGHQNSEFYYASLPTTSSGLGGLWRNRVAFAGEFAAVAASGPETNHPDTSTGRVRVFRRPNLLSAWSVFTDLVPPDGALGDRFGWEIAMEGGRLVVGAPQHDLPGLSNCGAAYVFLWNGTEWAFEQKLIASDAGAFDQFGYSVGMSGNRILIGSPVDNTPAGTDAGSGYVFAWNGTAWVEEGRLLATDAAAFDILSFWVSIDGDRAALRTSYRIQGRGGLTYVFHWNGSAWVQEARVTTPLSSGGNGSDLVQSLAIRGDWLAIGNPIEMGNTGRVYIHKRNGSTWPLHSTLSNPNDPVATLFGCNLEFDTDETLVIGSFYNELFWRWALVNDSWNPFASSAGLISVNSIDPLPTFPPLAAFGMDAKEDRVMTAHGHETTGVTGLMFEPLPPEITRQPLAQVERSGDQASFSVIAYSNFVQPMSFLWRRDGVDLIDGPAPGGGMIIGSQTPSMIITSVGSADAGVYQCLVIDTCNAILTSPAVLTIEPAAPPHCPGDADGNRLVNFADITSVLAAFNSTCP